MDFAVGSSPHTRGAPKRAFKNARIVGIIPAYAGSTQECLQGDRADKDHPRIRGEHNSRVGCFTFSGGSSPHTRGALECGDIPCNAHGIIPAYAGSTKIGRHDGRRPRDHPRIRGEHLWWSCSRPSRSGIIPAYAGSTCRSRGAYRSSRDHPRIRGEHRQVGVDGVGLRGSSPHTRGAPVLRQAPDQKLRIIPAYAGSTIYSNLKVPEQRDHPRIRGEHVAWVGVR